jgi:N6-adenosine-specific RNA methylase IME4
VTIGANSNDSDGFTSNGLVQTYETNMGTGHKLEESPEMLTVNLVGVAISSDGQTIAVGGPLGTTVQPQMLEASVHYII